MNNAMRLRSILLLITLLISQLLTAQSFSGGKTEQQIEEEAFDFFDAEIYQKAISLYQELINVYPQDPEYNYYLGVCQVELNVQIPQAIKHLKIAFTKDVNSSVPYYLGRAFHMDYQFNSAIRYYKKFKENYKKKSLGIERLIEMCKNGLPLVNSYYVIDLKEKKTVYSNQFFRNYKIEGFQDRLSKKTKFIKSRHDGNGDKDVVCLANKDQYVYFSSYGKNKKNGRDLYRAKRLQNGAWGEWENLSHLNSRFDEIYPFMAADNRTLYFCSQGHSSMGGFDIFKSVYNEITDTWTEPENLGFPFNSVANDLFFATDLNDEYACFASSRENGKNELTIYKIKLSDKPEQKVVINPEQLAQIAVLEVGKQLVEENKIEAYDIKYTTKYNNSNFPYFSLRINDDLVYHALTEFKSSEARDIFIESKNDMFNSDSLNDVTEKFRKNLSGSKPDSASALSEQISLLEQRLFDLKKQAEDKVIRARTAESDYLDEHIIGIIETDVVALEETVNEKNVTPKDIAPKGVISKDIIPESVTPKDVISKEESPLPAKKATVVGAGYFYHIQIGVFSGKRDQKTFLGLQPVKEDVVNNGKLYRYLFGKYSTFASAKQAIPEVKQLFPNAFVVAYKDGKRTNLGMAIKITDKGYKPVPVERSGKVVSSAKPKRKAEVKETGKLAFKVQVGAYSEGIPQDVKNKLRAFDKYPIEYTTDSRGYTICTVGSFDSYSKVSKLKMELREAGLRDAFTVAYSGSDKVTIQQALEILRQ